jgi:hypothetical protein
MHRMNPTNGMNYRFGGGCCRGLGFSSLQITYFLSVPCIGIFHEIKSGRLTPESVA